VSLFGLIVQLAAEFAGCDELRGNVAFPCSNENARLGDIGEHQRDGGGDRFGRTSFGDSDKVRALARTKDADTHWGPWHRTHHGCNDGAGSPGSTSGKWAAARQR